MYIVKAEADQIEKIVDISVRAFETDVNVGGVKGDYPPGFDSVEWHKQMAREGHLYKATIGKDLVGAAILSQFRPTLLSVGTVIRKTDLQSVHGGEKRI